MDPDVARIAMLFAVIAAFGTVMTVVGVTASRFLARRPKPEEQDAPVVSEARFARLERAIDVIAVEVERIAEAQRFSAQLMAETMPDRLSPPGQNREEARPRPGSTTPR